MNRQRGFILLAGALVVIGLAMAAGGSRPAVPSLPKASFELTGVDLNLQCNLKVPGGLAQCGSQASSCKNCHEVKGEDSVNAKGDWHISHAFGDFCEFCHGGNVQAVDQEAAHQGLVAPLSDVKTNCSTCHEDFQPKAEVYATALGVTAGASNTGGSNPPTGSGAGDSTGSTQSQSAPAPAPEAGAAPSGTQIVDYAAQYVSGGATPISAGNLIVGGLLAVTVAGGGALVYWNEKRLKKLPAQSVASVASAKPKANVETQAAEIAGSLSPELAKLLPTLQALDPRTLRALKIILADRKRGEEMLQSLSVINFSVLEEMKRLDKRELSLLLALASEA